MLHKIIKIFITHFILYIFNTIYSFKKKSSINKNFNNTCTVLISKLTTDNTTIAGINYKEQHECECDPTVLTNYDIWRAFLIFFINIWPDNGLFRPKLVATIWNNKVKRKLCQTEYLFCFILIVYFNTKGCLVQRLIYCCVLVKPAAVFLSFNYYCYLLLLLLPIRRRVRSYNHFRQRPIHYPKSSTVWNWLTANINYLNRNLTTQDMKVLEICATSHYDQWLRP